MTERLPEGADPEQVARQRLDAALARGELQTPTSWRGRPLDLSDAGDPDWWIRRRLRDEEHVALPPALQLRRDRDRLLATLDELPFESGARAALEELNRRIRYAAGHVIDGPPSTLMPVDVETLLDGWRRRRPPPPPAPPPAPATRWQRFLGRLCGPG
jgi:hypothetical protein